MPDYNAVHEAMVAEVAAELLAQQPDVGDLPVNVVDQLDAASREAHGLAQRLGDTIGGGQPLVGAERLRDGFARMIVSQSTATKPPAVCEHIEANTAQPTVIDLQRCIIYCTRPFCDFPEQHPPDAAGADRCDWCHEGGCDGFRAVTLQLGPMLVAGNACDKCWKHFVAYQDAQSPDHPGDR
jgi:hypothetical protein